MTETEGQLAMADDTTAFPATITFAKSLFPVTFGSGAEAKEWGAAEFAFWSSFASGHQPNPWVQGILDNANQATRIQTFQGSDSDLVAQLRSLEQNYIPTSKSFRILVKHLEQQQKRDIAGFVFGLLFWPDTSRSLSANNDRVIEAFAIAGVYRVFERLIGSEADIVSGIKKIGDLSSGLTQQTVDMQKLFNAELTKFRALEEGYKAKLATDAPREYWEKRAQNHSDKADRARRAWHWSLGAVVMLVLVVGFLAFFSDSSASVPKQLHATVLYVTLVGLGIWWLRQKVIELRSHEHLAEDAAERVTMIETYTAMKSTGLSADDLALVLTALYRPATTGLVRDDGGAPVMPLEFVLKKIQSATGQTRGGGND